VAPSVECRLSKKRHRCSISADGADVVFTDTCLRRISSPEQLDSQQALQA